MLTYLVSAMSGNNHYVIEVFTLEGKTWDLVEYVYMNQRPNLMIDKKLNYEFFEVLSDHVHAIIGHVAYLDKVKVFTCLFQREGDPFLVPAKDMF